jgi:predicted O-methyltransferase YrrM
MKLFKSKRSLTERFVRRIFYKHYARNLLYELQIRARKSSADYAESQMQDAVIFWKLKDILNFCIDHSPKEGLILEFGVATGNTTNIIANAAKPRTVHGFDSFEGLPEDWAGHIETRGAFSRKGLLPKVSENVMLYKGWFSDSLPDFLKKNTEPVAFLHIDCDLYSSTRDVLKLLKDRLQTGTIIEFDEYFNYPNWQQHEYKAWQEFVTEHNIKYQYLAITASEGRVAIKIF